MYLFTVLALPLIWRERLLPSSTMTEQLIGEWRLPRCPPVVVTADFHTLRHHIKAGLLPAISISQRASKATTPVLPFHFFSPTRTTTWIKGGPRCFCPPDVLTNVCVTCTSLLSRSLSNQVDYYNLFFFSLKQDSFKKIYLRDIWNENMPN